MENMKMKLARVEARLSQEALAKLIGVSRQTINMIERGEYNPSLQLCIKICKALDRTLDQLFWEEK
ncbi:MAG: helix-turn-helix transcriptional regulator [Erysipelotrichaceae bacterium]|nr:helix-turn-helix transcriptional regulator [Erysipelotrichaceae bacterium]